MKALVKTEKGPGHVELKTDWPKPTAKEGWVVVEVAGCGICGTDLHILEDTHKNWPPVVLGHEYTGRIVEIGAGVTKYKVGDRVVCEQHTLACMTCDACRRGAIHLCPNKRSPGWGIDGAFADFVTLPENLLHKVPEGVSFRAATITEPTAICITGLDRVALQSGERVLVIGPGPIGLISALLAKASGASEVLVVARKSSRDRLELASKLGLSTYEIIDEDPIAKIGDAFDVAIDSTGAALSLAVSATRRLGRVLELGLASTPTIDFALNAAMTRSIAIHMSMSSEYSSWDRALAFMASGTYDPTPLSAIYTLDDWQKAFHDVEGRKVVKAIITPQDPSVLDLRK
jgi:L-iditol 2-dehydrogenase